MHIKKNNYNIYITSLLFLFGVYIAYTRGSNFSDADSFSVIKTFLLLLDGEGYNPSRNAYGHPIPEFLIGIMSYNLGTRVTNIFCFLLFFLSIIIFYSTFLKKIKNVHLFILLIISNTYLLLDNTNSIDYPIALFFLSVGFYFLKNQKNLLSYVFFGMTIACRPNFLTFIYPAIVIFFFHEIKEKKFKNFFVASLVTTIIGLLFFIPLFDLHNYSLNFLEIPFLMDKNDSIRWYGGPKMEFSSLFPRFVYKIYLIIGVFSSFLFLLFFKNIIKKIKFTEIDNIIFIFIIFINIFVFYFSPTKILLINPFIIFSYILIFKYLDKKKIYLLIILNFLQWFIVYDLVNIKYKEKKICWAREAISYNFNLSIQKGKIIDYLTNKSDTKECYAQFMGIYSDNFKKGLPLKLSK